MSEAILSQLRAQDTARRTIERALETGRVHHAYLFAGPDGVGKELAAFGLAQALVCEKRGEASVGLFGSMPASFLACGTCSACARAVPRDEKNLPVHPDIVVLERALYLPQAIGRRTPETQDISIDQVRSLGGTSRSPRSSTSTATMPPSWSSKRCCRACARCEGRRQRRSVSKILDTPR
jgi:DNA polymerase III subunit delta'